MRASIITPTLQAGRHIAACIANVAAQGDAVLEHIVVDGGSTDGTVEHVTAMAARDDRLRLIRGPDRGQSDALNKGIAAARGAVIGILNVDDIYRAGAVARGVAILAACDAPSLVAGICRIEDGAGRLVMWNRPDDLRLDSLLRGWSHAQFPCNPSAYFYHRAVHDAVGGYDVDDHYQMDLDFILRCAARVRMDYVAEHWGDFRLTPGTKTHDDPHLLARRAVTLARHAAARAKRG